MELVQCIQSMINIALALPVMGLVVVGVVGGVFTTCLLHYLLG